MARPKGITLCHPGLPHFARGMCRECYRNVRNAEVREAYKADPSRQKEAMKRYKEKDPEGFKAKNNERQKKYARENLTHAQRKAGWTQELTTKKLEEQGGLCDICKIVLVPESRNGFDSLHRDHDHATGKARSLLCHQCNTTLGTYEKKIRGSVHLFEDYLKKHESPSLTEQEGGAIIKDS
jgi:hypothetical protein